MNINLTLIGQMIAFAAFVLFCMKYVWPPILAAMAERAEKIADGLAAADRAGTVGIVDRCADTDCAIGRARNAALTRQTQDQIVGHGIFQIQAGEKVGLRVVIG